jgi:hypothetical protein
VEQRIGNLFAYTRDDYAQPAPQLEAMALADLLKEVAAGLEHTTRLRDNRFDQQSSGHPQHLGGRR